MSMNEMENKIRELRQLQHLIEEAQQEAEAIKDVIKAQLTAQGVDELRAGEYRVSWKQVKSTRIDTDADRVTINEDICATAKGYEYLCEMALRKGGTSHAT